MHFLQIRSFIPLIDNGIRHHTSLTQRGKPVAKTNFLAAWFRIDIIDISHRKLNNIETTADRRFMTTSSIFNQSMHAHENIGCNLQSETVRKDNDYQLFTTIFNNSTRWS
jgi:hypothetical protein